MTTDTSSGGGTARMRDYRVYAVERAGPRIELCLCTMLSQSKRPSAFSEATTLSFGPEAGSLSAWVPLRPE
jgi:hypothetical protein